MRALTVWRSLSTPQADSFEAHRPLRESHFPLTRGLRVVRSRGRRRGREVVRICAAWLSGGGLGRGHLAGKVMPWRCGAAWWSISPTLAAVLEIRPEEPHRPHPARPDPRAPEEELRATGPVLPVDPAPNASLGAIGRPGLRNHHGALWQHRAETWPVRWGWRTARCPDGTRAAKKPPRAYDLTALVRPATRARGPDHLKLTRASWPARGHPAPCISPSTAIEGAVDCGVEVIQTGLPVARDRIRRRGHGGPRSTPIRRPISRHARICWWNSTAPEDSVARDAARFARIAADHGATGIDHATRAEDRRRLWQMRHHAYWAILASRPGARAIVTDVCVPISALARAVAETRADIDAKPDPRPDPGPCGRRQFPCDPVDRPRKR